MAAVSTAAFSAAPTLGAAPLDVLFSYQNANKHEGYGVTFGDGRSSGMEAGVVLCECQRNVPCTCPPIAEVRHTYATPGTYISTLYVNPSCTLGNACPLGGSKIATTSVVVVGGSQPTCNLNVDKQVYRTGDTIVASWTSRNATAAVLKYSVPPPNANGRTLLSEYIPLVSENVPTSGSRSISVGTETQTYLELDVTNTSNGLSFGCAANLDVNPSPLVTVNNGNPIHTSSGDVVIHGTSSTADNITVMITKVSGTNDRNPVYDSGEFSVSAGSWSMKVSPPIPNGQYTVAALNSKYQVVAIEQLYVLRM